MSLSWSAPRFTKDDELNERSSLRHEELQEIEREILGTDGNIPENASTIALALREFHEELDIIPEEEKRAFLQADAVSPQLVYNESKPILFLRAESFDPKVRTITDLLSLSIFPADAYNPFLFY